MYRITFDYDNRGYGDLIVYNGDEVIDYWECRTGSIDLTGKLVNAICPGNWTGRVKSVDTTEIAMVVDGFGKKFRLWNQAGEWTNYLIHPDGNKPGSQGCIVPINLTPVHRLIALFALLDLIIDKQGIVDVEIEKGE